MRLRPVLALAACTALAAGTGVAAAAAPKPVCNLVTDKAGDTSVLPGGVVTDDAMDITSVDVATDKKRITTVIRVKKLAARSASAPTGTLWQVNFTANDIVFSMSAHAYATGEITYTSSYATTASGSLYAGGTTGVFDLKKSEIRMTAPLTLFAGQASIKPGKTVISALGGNTGAEIVVPDSPNRTFGSPILTYAPFEADVTSGGKDYKAGTASCVTVGK